MVYCLYEIKNNINGKTYVGVHKTNDITDGYMGSGKVIKQAIKKYGLVNFSKIILETFDTPEAMFAREKEVVTEEFLIRSDVYNLRLGGFGGFDHIRNAGLHYKGYNSAAERNRALTLTNRGKKRKAEQRQRISEAHKGIFPTKETRQKMTLSQTGLARKKVTCLHCGTIGGGGAMKQWHFNNCKFQNKEVV